MFVVEYAINISRLSDRWLNPFEHVFLGTGVRWLNPFEHVFLGTGVGLDICVLFVEHIGHEMCTRKIII